MEKSFLGTGMKFPPEIDKNTGRFKVSSDEDNIRESVHIILMTQRKERWTRPEFGSNILSYAFMDSSVTVMSMLERDIRSTIIKQEPRITDVDVVCSPPDNNGKMLVTIDYVVADGYTTGSLVFPFYLGVGGETPNEQQ